MRGRMAAGESLSDALKACAPGKAEAEKSPPAVTYSSEVRGGGFQAVQNPSGTWTIRNVPIFCEHQVKTPSGTLDVDSDWMRKAYEKAERRYRDDYYLPPVHINHHGTGRDVSRAGFYRLRGIRTISYEGKRVACMFADLVHVPDEVYQQIKSHGLPYRSVEIHKIERPEIDSLALMADEVPFFRLPLLTIGEEVPFEGTIGPAKRSAGTPALAYRALGSGGVSLLFRLDDGGGDMPPSTSPRQYMDEEKKPMKVEGELHMMDEEEEDLPLKELGGPDEPEEQMMDGGLADQLRPLLEQMLSLLDGGGDGGGDHGPEPVDLSADRSKARRYRTDETIEYMAKARALEAKVDAMAAKDKQRETLDTLVRDLSDEGFEGEMFRDEITTVYSEDGERAARRYVEGVIRYGAIAPPNLDPVEYGAQGGRYTGGVEADVQKFAALGSTAIERARLAAVEYDELKKRLRLGYSRTYHVAQALEADGFDVNATEWQEG